MNKNKIIVLACAAFLAIPALAAAESAPSTGDSASSAVVSVAPSVGDPVSSAVSVSAPSTGDPVSSAAPASAPSTGSSASSAASGSAPSTGDAVSSAGPSAPVTPTPSNSSSGGGSSSSSGSFVGGGSFYGGSTVAPIVAVASIPGFCPFVVTGSIDLGGTNDIAQVTKLQTFLKNVEGSDISVSGIFDQKTEAAVIAFQNKYMSDIMGPWGATKASGKVYLTTAKKINQVACNTALDLTSADLSTINAYKQAAASGQAASGPVGANQGANGSVAAGPSAPASASSSNASAQNTAAAGNISIGQRFWNFILGLFHR